MAKMKNKKTPKASTAPSDGAWNAEDLKCRGALIVDITTHITTIDSAETAIKTATAESKLNKTTIADTNKKLADLLFEVESKGFIGKHGSMPRFVQAECGKTLNAVRCTYLLRLGKARQIIRDENAQREAKPELGDILQLPELESHSRAMTDLITKPDLLVKVWGEIEAGGIGNATAKSIKSKVDGALGITRGSGVGSMTSNWADETEEDPRVARIKTKVGKVGIGGTVLDKLIKAILDELSTPKVDNSKPPEPAWTAPELRAWLANGMTPELQAEAEETLERGGSMMLLKSKIKDVWDKVHPRSYGEEASFRHLELEIIKAYLTDWQEAKKSEAEVGVSAAKPKTFSEWLANPPESVVEGVEQRLKAWEGVADVSIAEWVGFNNPTNVGYDLELTKEFVEAIRVKLVAEGKLPKPEVEGWDADTDEPDNFPAGEEALEIEDAALEPAAA